MSSSNSPCAACKFLRRKCTQECVFAPYFPPDQPQRFSSVHKVFGASNVAKLLNELPSEQREDAVNSLAYEAEARLRDPVYGCVGMISILQQRLKQVQGDLYSAKKELATYIGSSALVPMIQPPFPNPNLSPAAMLQQHYNISPLMAIPSGPGVAAGPSHAGPSHAASGGPQLVIREPQPQQHQQQQPQNQQYLDAQQLAALAVSDDQDLVRNWEQQQQQQQQQQFMRFHGSGVGGYEGTVVVGGGSAVSGGGGGGFNQAGSTSAGALPSLALGASSPFDQTGYEQQIQPPQQQHQQQQLSPSHDGSLGQLLLLQQPTTPQQQLGHGDLAQGQGTHHHLEHNHHQQQQQGSSSQSHHHHHHQNLLLQLQHQHEHIQQPQLQLQQQQRDDGIE